MKRFLSICMICVILTMATGCVGQFRLTKRVHAWNQSFDNKWAQEGVFLACVLLPVYGISFLGDAVIFNSLEFWGKDNPMASTTVGEGDEKVVFQKRADGSVLVESGDKSVVLKQTVDGVVASDTSADIAYKASFSDSEVVSVHDKDGKLVLESRVER